MSISDQARKLMSDEERAKIVRQATEDTCKFLDSLPRKQYKDGWPEDKWEEEMEKHPLFTSEVSEGQDVSPLIGAFQSLKYDPEYNDPIELAKSYKDDGNEQFKHKRCRLAVIAYSEGIKVKAEDSEINTILYTNRAAAYYHMGNYRKSLEDVTVALALNPDHVKAIHRGALCTFETAKYDECISWCERGLKLNDKDKILLDLKVKAEKQLKKQEQFRLKRKVELASLDKLTKAIKARGIHIVEEGLTPESVVCDYAGSSAKVRFTSTGTIDWPVVFMYPQYGITDFIPDFNECGCFFHYFRLLFQDNPPDWDIKKQYTPENLKVYFCDKRGDIIPVNPNECLQKTMSHKRFQVTCGTLHFFIVPSEYDEIFRSQNHVVDT